MIELLIVIAIIAVLFILLLTVLRNQVGRGRDARRKADLEKIKIAFEEYFNDFGCYPPPDILDNCGGDELQPYMQSVPCDPFTGESYVYIPESSCDGFRVFTALEDDNDPSIARVGCDAPGACGFGADLDYGVSVGVPLAQPGGTGGLQPDTYACTPQGSCNEYQNPSGAGCPLSWTELDCAGQCGNPENRCAQ